MYDTYSLYKYRWANRKLVHDFATQLKTCIISLFMGFKDYTRLYYTIIFMCFEF